MGSNCTAWSYTKYVMNVNRRWLIHSFVITWFCISQRFTPQAPGLIWELIITCLKNQPRSFFIWSFKALDWGLNCSNPQQFCSTPNLEFAKNMNFVRLNCSEMWMKWFEIYKVLKFWILKQNSLQQPLSSCRYSAARWGRVSDYFNNNLPSMKNT